MKRLFATTAALALAVLVGTAAETGTKFGAGVALTTATPIAEVAATPADFVGKTVRLDGVVTAVCENMGCWMQLKDEKTDKTVRIKVDDGVIVFPLTAKGKKASAQGVFEKVDVKAEEAEHAAMAKKDAMPKKDAAAADPHAAHQAASAKPHAEPAPVAYQLKATGAIVY
jgi:hypothetical protein